MTAVQSHSPLTSLMVRISTRNIASCLRSCNLTLLSLDTSRHPHGEASMQPSHARLIHVCLRIVQTRALPDLFAVPEDEEGAVDVMALAVRALFEVLSLGKALEATQGHHSTQGRALAQRAAQLIGDLYRAEDKGKMWKVAFEKAWDTLVREDLALVRQFEMYCRCRCWRMTRSGQEAWQLWTRYRAHCMKK